MSDDLFHCSFILELTPWGQDLACYLVYSDFLVCYHQSLSELYLGLDNS